MLQQGFKLINVSIVSLTRHLLQDTQPTEVPHHAQDNIRPIENSTNHASVIFPLRKNRFSARWLSCLIDFKDDDILCYNEPSNRTRRHTYLSYSLSLSLPFPLSHFHNLPFSLSHPHYHNPYRLTISLNLGVSLTLHVSSTLSLFSSLPHTHSDNALTEKLSFRVYLFFYIISLPPSLFLSLFLTISTFCVSDYVFRSLSVFSKNFTLFYCVIFSHSVCTLHRTPTCECLLYFHFSFPISLFSFSLSLYVRACSHFPLFLADTSQYTSSCYNFSFSLGSFLCMSPMVFLSQNFIGVNLFFLFTVCFAFFYAQYKCT